MAIELKDRISKKPDKLVSEIPVTFDLNDILQQYKVWCYVDIYGTQKKRKSPKFYSKDRQYMMDCIAYFLGLLQKKTPIHYNNNGTVHASTIMFPLHSLVLQRINRNFSNIKKFFQEAGFIDVNNSYKRDEWCKKYSFSDKYRTHKTKKYYITNKKLIEKSYDYYMERKGGMIGEDESIYSNYEVKIDSTRAYKYITDEYYKGNITDEQYSAYYSSIYRMENKEIYSVLDDFSGRLHTNITNLKKELRQFVYFVDESKQDVVEIDVKNSQLLMLTAFLDKNTFDKVKPLLTRKIRAGVYEQVVSNNLLENIENYIINNDISNKEDILKFKYNAFNGEVYEKFVEELKDNGYYDRLSRKKLKTVFFIWLFSPLGHKVFEKSLSNKKLNEFLDINYPNLYEYITFLRNQTDSKLIPRLLQLTESGINLNLIGKKISFESEKESDRIMFTTIHDSFLTPICFRDKIVKKIKDTYKEIFNIDVNLHIKTIKNGKKFDHDKKIDDMLNNKVVQFRRDEAKRLADKIINRNF